MKRILYLTFYFEPDLCAGSFRNSPLVKELARQTNGEAEVHVLTTMPNRYQSFFAECPAEEKTGNLLVKRILLPAHQSGFVDQINSFRSYYRWVSEETRDEKYDMVVASSSRLFTAYLGYKIARKCEAPLYLDIRDIFVDTLNDVLPNKLVKFFLLPVLKSIEKKIFGYAIHINLISEGFKPYFRQYATAKYSYYTNGIDKEFELDNPYTELLAFSPLTITYAGNIGEGQGLHKIVPDAASLLGNGYVFRIIGDGGTRELLENEIKQRNLTNVSIEKPVKRAELIEIYKRSHFLFIHLNDYRAFEKVLPSKVFELGALPRPLLAGVNGYAREFIRKNVSNSILFDPGNAVELADSIRGFSYKNLLRKDFIDRFGRENINEKMAASIKRYL
ncbi:MAG TPA: glycosyltransferase family 4 protein [Niabella sp.]